MTVLEAIKERKSVRNYAAQAVKQEDLETIMNTAMWAPNAMNKQGWHFTVVTNPELLSKMNDACRKGMAAAPIPIFQERAKNPEFQAFFYAPAVIVVSIAEDKFSLFDAGAATENICLAAKELGYGTCVTASTEFMLAGDPALTETLNFPEGYKFCCAITLGIETDGPDDHIRDRKEDVVTFLR